MEAISNIERGKSLLPLDQLAVMAEVLEVPITEILELPGGTGSAIERTELEMAIRTTARALPIEHLRVAARQITALAELAER